MLRSTTLRRLTTHLLKPKPVHQFAIPNAILASHPQPPPPTTTYHGTHTPSLRFFTDVPTPPTSDTEDEMGILKGQVKWFDVKKGFGFIVPENGSGDVFVHQTDIHAQGFRSLAEGEEVEFEIVQEPNGRRKAKGVTGPDGVHVQGAPRSASFGDQDDGWGDRY